MAARGLGTLVHLSIFICALAFVGSADLRAQSALSKLEQSLKQTKSLLDRVEKGKSPCFSIDCQHEKSKILNETRRLADTISWKPSPQNEAFQAARFFVAYPFQRPSEEFPETMKQWKAWWERRYSYETKYRFQWMSLVNQITSFYDALDIILRRAKTSSALDKELIQEAWDRQAGRISLLMREHAQLIETAKQEELKGRDSSDLKQEALALSKEREALEKNFGGSFAAIMQELFPQVEFKRSVSSLAHLQLLAEDYQVTKIFDADFLSHVSYWRSQLKKFSNKLQEFNDLEYGVVGLRNFNTSTNPAVAAEQEIPIQEFLDKFDGTARAATSIAAFYLMTTVLGVATDSILLKIVIPSGLQLVGSEKDFELSEVLWAPAHRTEEILASLPDLQDRMQQRFRDLLKTRSLLLQRIQELESQISELNQQGEPS